MSIRTCEGCINLNKKKKTKPCDIFNCKYDIEKNIYIRPSKCKNKIKKIDPKKELKRIKEEAIDLFQTYIRYRDNFTCCCCGFSVSKDDKDAKKLVHAGHFISRSISNLLLDEKNCFAQCRSCNYLQDKVSVNPKYILFLIEKFGKDIFEYYYNKIFKEEKIERDYNYWLEQKEYWLKKLQEIKNVEDKQ